MKKQKIIPLGIVSLLIISILASTVPSVSAQSPILIAVYGMDNQSDKEHLQREFNSTDAGVRAAIAETFQAEQTGYLTGVMLMLGLYGTPNTNLTVEIRRQTAFNQAINITDGCILAVSESENLDGIPSYSGGTFYYTAVTFQFDQTVQLIADQYYSLVVYGYPTVLLDNSNTVVVGTDNSATSYAGYYKWKGSGSFETDTSTAATVDVIFAVFGQETAAAEPTPTPTPSPTPEAMPNWISDIIDAIIPIFTPLLVIFICGALGWRFAGAWGFFAGINLAIVLMYVVAPQYMPLWSIVAVVIVDIALLFGKIGFDRR